MRFDIYYVGMLTAVFKGQFRDFFEMIKMLVLGTTIRRRGKQVQFNVKRVEDGF